MKKIALFLMVLIGLVVIVGCKNRKTVVFTPEGQVAEDSSDSKTVIKVQKDETTPPVVEPIKLTTEATGASKDAVVAKPAVAFEVTSLAKNISQKTKSYQVIEGTTPAGTDKVLVNDLPLNKYKAGETKWSYIAAVSLGNLKTGDNQFTVKAQDADGKELGSKTFTITYTGRESARLASTGPSSTLALSLIMAMAAGLFSLRRRNA